MTIFSLFRIPDKKGKTKAPLSLIRAKAIRLHDIQNEAAFCSQRADTEWFKDKCFEGILSRFHGWAPIPGPQVQVNLFPGVLTSKLLSESQDLLRKEVPPVPSSRALWGHIGLPLGSKQRGQGLLL